MCYKLSIEQWVRYISCLLSWSSHSRMDRWARWVHRLVNTLKKSWVLWYSDVLGSGGGGSDSGCGVCIGQVGGTLFLGFSLEERLLWWTWDEIRPQEERQMVLVGGITSTKVLGIKGMYGKQSWEASMARVRLGRRRLGEERKWEGMQEPGHAKSHRLEQTI